MNEDSDELAPQPMCPFIFSPTSCSERSSSSENNNSDNLRGSVVINESHCRISREQPNGCPSPHPKTCSRNASNSLEQTDIDLLHLHMKFRKRSHAIYTDSAQRKSTEGEKVMVEDVTADTSVCRTTLCADSTTVPKSTTAGDYVMSSHYLSRTAIDSYVELFCLGGEVALARYA